MHSTCPYGAGHEGEPAAGEGQRSGARGGQRGTVGMEWPWQPLHLAAWPAPNMLSPLPTVSTDALREPGRRTGENH